MRLGWAITEFLEDVQLSKKPKTFAAYAKALQYFVESSANPLLADISRRDLLKYVAHLRERGLSPRTVYNKHQLVISFLKAQGITGIVEKKDTPRYTLQEPEVYTSEELDRFFQACEPSERLFFNVLLQTGMREQEIKHMTDASIKFADGVIMVTDVDGWNPKAYKSREIPVSDKLLESLQGFTKWLLPEDVLGLCKRIAARADLNPDGWWLHKFRATFATRALQHGVDLRTVQAWLGHSDIESTMRYLKPQRGAAIREKVNQIFG